MEEDFSAKVRRKKTRKIVIAVILIAACIILAFGITHSGTGTAGSGSASVTIEIRCDQLSENMSALNDPALLDYVPQDGTILAETEVKIEPGVTTVFDVTDKACFDSGVQIEYSTSPGYNSHYIEGIGYLYEFSAGKYSGWMFTVDGEIANYGADHILLEGGEKIQWFYAVDYRMEDADEQQDQ